MAYTSAELVASVQRDSQNSLRGKIQVADVLAWLTEEMIATVVPMLMATREQYLVAPYDTPLLAGTDNSYPVPSRAVGESMQQVLLTAAGGKVFPLDYLEPRRQALGRTTSGYMLEDDSVRVMNPPAGFSTLRLTYFRVPNRIVSVSECGKVLSRTSTTVTLTAAPPATFTTSTPLDLVSAIPGFRWISTDLAPSGITGAVLTFASVPDRLAPGDWVALAGEAPLAQIPATLWPVLVQAVVAQYCMAIGSERTQEATQKLGQRMKAAGSTLTPRVQDSPRVVVNRFAPGFGRRRRRL